MNPNKTNINVLEGWQKCSDVDDLPPFAWCVGRLQALIGEEAAALDWGGVSRTVRYHSRAAGGHPDLTSPADAAPSRTGQENIRATAPGDEFRLILSGVARGDRDKHT